MTRTDIDLDPPSPPSAVTPADADDNDGDIDPAPAAAAAKKARRQIPESTRRLLFIVLGVVVLLGSIAGFYLTSAAFDERVSVTVAARSIEAGETLTAADLQQAQIVAGAIPYVPWTPAAVASFEGRITAQPILSNALVRHDMLIDAETVASDLAFEMIIPLDLSLVTGELHEGDPVLLADPGVRPAETDPGRPAKVVREFELTNFEGSQMRLLLPPEELVGWERLLAEVGGTLMVVPVGLGGDAESIAERVDAWWETQWNTARAELAAAIGDARPEAGPGELELVIALNTSLVPTAIGPNELVLLIDPGLGPLGNDPGRARSVIGTLQLEDFSNGQMTVFAPPEDWLYWRSLPEQLGAVPMILPIPEGTDVDDMIERLDAVWLDEWQGTVEAAVAVQR
ncbi:SAF domain-containing protein [Candidatus Poriferisodalis sp.]|uniref:SAF domain-containing protein n=1 Tax=Candidatus Poriferisodalis sp. TaxID=3101277 RepID=UPI003B02CF58